MSARPSSALPTRRPGAQLPTRRPGAQSPTQRPRASLPTQRPRASLPTRRPATGPSPSPAHSSTATTAASTPSTTVTFTYRYERPSGGRQWRAGVYVMSCIAGCLIAFVSVAAFHSMLVDRQERLSRAEDELRDLHYRQERLRLRIYRAESPVNVVQQADALGLVEPDDVENLSVPAGVVVAPPNETDDPSSAQARDNTP